MAKKKVVNEETLQDDLFASIAGETGGDILGELENCKFFVDTGTLATNYICSGRFLTGGIPGQRITEVYGPSASGKSLIASNVLFGCQKIGGWAIILDCENATNADWMEKASHLNTNRVIRYTPFTLEEAFLKMHNAIKKIRALEVKMKKDRKPIVIVYDSISVSPCEREYRETELPEGYTPAQWKTIVGAKEQPGERAKVCGKELRKIAPILEKEDVTILVINQTREKIGVLYGCFQYNSRVVLADGSTVKIGKIVNQNMVGLEVMSFNPENGNIEPKKIIECHDNGNLQEDEKFLQFTVRKRGKNGRTQFACTPNHQIFVPYLKNFSEFEGYSWDNISSKEVNAGDLKIGDNILVSQPYYLNEDQKQIVYGSILGDGEIRTPENKSCAQLRLDHGLEQTEYCQWKEEILNPWIGYSFIDDTKYNRVGFDTIPMFELIELGKYKEDYNVPIEVMKSLSPLGLAIWYMDDGSYRSAEQWGNGQAVIYCTKFNNRTQLKEMLQDRFGLDCQEFNKGLKFNSENTKKLHEIVAPYIHPSMNYKLQHSFRNSFSYEISEPDSCFCYKAVPSEIIDIYEKPPTRSKKKFDITVEGNHSYIVDGAIVHNSPETTAGGGKALEFYASCRLRTTAKKKIENKALKTFSGINMQVENRKNRAFRPFSKHEGIKLYFETGINPITGLLTALLEDERVLAVGKGGNYTVAPDYLPEGKDEVKFKSSLERNDVPMQVLLDCPKLIDGTSSEEILKYLEPFQAAINYTDSGNFVEKIVAFDADGNALEAEDEEYSEDE